MNTIRDLIVTNPQLGHMLMVSAASFPAPNAIKPNTETHFSQFSKYKLPVWEVSGVGLS